MTGPEFVSPARNGGLGIAVVMATRDRPRLLARCLRALAQQRHPAHEVIVIDDGSAKDTAQILTDFSSRLPLQVIRHERATGPSSARNEGWRAASTDFVAFTDDDCRPDPEWIAALTAAAAQSTVVVGRTLPDPEDGPLTSILDRTMRVDDDDGRFSTCNVLYLRDLLESLGGFDPDFSRPFGEDTDLGQRAIASGADSTFAPRALVYHAVHRTGMWRTVRERWRSGEVVRLAKRYPHLRTTVWHGAFWQDYHPAAIRAILGVMLLPLTPAGLLAAQDWLEEAPRRLEEQTHRYLASSNSQRVRETAALALLDAVEVASCARGSLRHRTFFL